VLVLLVRLLLQRSQIRQAVAAGGQRLPDASVRRLKRTRTHAAGELSLLGSITSVAPRVERS
jgi:hypothetical protein